MGGGGGGTGCTGYGTSSGVCAGACASEGGMAASGSTQAAQVTVEPSIAAAQAHPGAVDILEETDADEDDSGDLYADSGLDYI
jgi:hypothetical protein